MWPSDLTPAVVRRGVKLVHSSVPLVLVGEWCYLVLRVLEMYVTTMGTLHHHSALHMEWLLVVFCLTSTLLLVFIRLYRLEM